MRALLLILLFMLGGAGAGAVTPDEKLSDPRLEQRARDISAELRCVVCQNQSIDDSDADLARDLRTIVRERLVAGDSDEQVVDFIVARYGEFVLLKPRLGAHTAVLWAAPFLVLLLGGVLAIWFIRGRKAQGASAPLSEAEKTRIAALMADAGDREGQQNGSNGTEDNLSGGTRGRS